MKRLDTVMKRSIVLVAGFVVLWGGCPRGFGMDWNVGMAREKITPEEPIWMSGYASRDRPAEGTRTELWAKATALEDAAGNRGVILSLDVVGFGRDIADQIVAGLENFPGLDRARIWINASHTHTGPVVGNNLETMYFLTPEHAEKAERYADQLVERGVSVARKALSEMVPRTVSYGLGRAGFGVNRRNNPEMLVPKLRFGGELRGPVDYSVPVLRVSDTQNRLVGVLFGYACHATTLSDYQWSGDYPGYAQIFIESRYPGAVAQFIAGCGADINPLPRRKPELAVRYGRELAESVEDVLDGVLTPVSPSLEIRFDTIALAFDQIPTRADWEEQARSDNRYEVARAQKWLKVLGEGREIPRTYEYPLSWWRLGEDLNLIGLGGEVVVEFALALQREWGRSTWVAGYSHDVMAYIPSRRIWEEGGYEGASAMIYYGLPSRWVGSVEEEVLAGVRRLAP
mgnify:CR=1 FL=1